MRLGLGFVALALLALGACAHREVGQAVPARVVYQAATTTVATSCVPAGLSQAPGGLETRLSLAAIPDGPTRYARAVADDLARMARMAETEPVLDACRRVPP